MRADRLTNWAKPLDLGSTEDPAVAVTFPIVAALCALVIAAITLLRGSNQSKSYDHWMFVLCVLVGIVVSPLVLRLRPRLGRTTVAAGLLAFGGLGFGIGLIERPDLATLYWCGFGLSVLVFSVLLTPLIWRLLAWTPRRRAARILLNSVSGLVVLSALTSALRSAHYLPEVVQNSYIINEVLAPAAGRTPDFNFIPQYSVLYGYLLKPFVGLVSLGGLLQLAVGMITLLTFITIFLAVLIAYRALDRRSFAVAALLVVPITCVTIEHGAGIEGTLFFSMAEVPIRVFSGMLLGVFAIEELVVLERGETRRVRWVALGIIAGLILWNSEDFGLAAALTLGALLLAMTFLTRRWTALLSWLVGTVLGLASYPIVAYLSGSSLVTSYVGYFPRQFTSGFASAPIQVPGPVVFVLPFVVATAAAGWVATWRRCRARSTVSDRGGALLRPALTAAFMGTWAVAGFVYYLNRSYASSQMQVLLPICGVCCAALAGLVLGPKVKHEDGNGPALAAPASARGMLRLLPIAIACSLCLAAVLQIPNPKLELDNFFNEPGQGYPTPSMQASIVDIGQAQQFLRASGESLAYLGEDGNYIELATGVEVASVFNYPDDFFHTYSSLAVGCAYLAKLSPEWIILSDLAYSDFAKFGSICNGLYTITPIPGVRADRAAERH